MVCPSRTREPPYSQGAGRAASFQYRCMATKPFRLESLDSIIEQADMSVEAFAALVRGKNQ